MSDLRLHIPGIPSLLRGHQEPDETGSTVLGVQARIRTKSVLWTHTNPLVTSGDAFRPRDTNQKRVTLPHASHGVYDQSIQLHHNLTASAAPVALDLVLVLPMTTLTGEPFGATIWTGVLNTDDRLTLAPEVGAQVLNTAERYIEEVPELRMPYDRFFLLITAQDAPDEGDLSIFTTWRQ